MKKLFLSLFLLIPMLFGAAVQAQTIPLSPERAGHTSTLLPSGLVLIAGGVNEGATLDSALLYNPSTHTFTATGAMTTPRSSHTATLLYDGTVLITGGDPDPSLPVLKSAEIYNPTTGKFTALAHAMSISRDKHTATLLHDGRVLIVGGKQADVYDPETQLFSVAANAPPNRTSHAAVRLLDDTVLVTGGYVGSLPARDAWIFDPTTTKFTLLPAMMLIARANHAMTLMIGGKVLVTGGFTGTSPHDEVDIYDPVAQTFTSTRHMLFHRSNHDAILLPDGKVLVIGGTTLESGFLATNEVYDPVQASWSADGYTMAENRTGMTATLLPDGDVLVAGGITGNKTLKTAEILDPVTHNFTKLPDMNVGRNQHSATLLPNGKVLLAAGSTDFVFLDSAEIFNPGNNSFTLVPTTLSHARKSQTETLLQTGKVLLTGGKSDNGDLPTCEIYDPSTNSFQSNNLPVMNDGRSLQTATLLDNGQVLVAGGRQGATPIVSSELYDPATNLFTFTGDLNIQRKRHAAVLLQDHTVLVEGGASIPNGMLVDPGTPTAEVYDPATGVWSINTPAGDMSTGRTEHAATVLQNGNVLVTGGISTTMPSDLYHPNATPGVPGTFTIVPGLIETRQRHIAILLDSNWGSLAGQVLEIGGASTGNSVFGGLQKALDTVEIYNPNTNTMSLFGHMTEPRQNNTATLLNDGRILITGGVSSPVISATAEVVPESAGTPAPTPSPVPIPTPTPPGNLINISTRLKVQPGEDALIGGFIITGTNSKNVLIRAIGPSLQNAVPPIAGALANPILELHKPDKTVVINDDWKSDQKAEIVATGAAPTNNLESAIVATLDPVDPNVPGSGQYTAVVQGADGGSGVALVEVYDLDYNDVAAEAQLANTSTRGRVETGDNVMIGGFIVGPTPPTGEQILVRAIGPSLAGAVQDPLLDPTLEIHDVDGNIIASNDDWASSDKAAIEATRLAPTNAKESAILLTDLPSGNYTAIVRGKNATSGIALVEAYHLN